MYNVIVYTNKKSFKTKWQNRKERPNRSKNNVDMVEKGKRDVGGGESVTSV